MAAVGRLLAGQSCGAAMSEQPHHQPYDSEPSQLDTYLLGGKSLNEWHVWLTTDPHR
jgi:hypothetical protein